MLIYFLVRMLIFKPVFSTIFGWHNLVVLSADVIWAKIVQNTVFKMNSNWLILDLFSLWKYEKKKVWYVL